MKGSHLLAWRGSQLHLLPQRALWWAEQSMLVVADAHFGKAAAFRAAGLPVPQGTTSQNLLELDWLLEQTAAHHLLFLGDFLHSKSARAPSTLQALRQWRSRHPSLKLTLVRGNHDLHAGDPPPELDVQTVDEPLRIGPYAFRHEPNPEPGTIAGHVHPVHVLRHGPDRLRLPCFHLCGQQLVLPAFGAFTGGYAVQQAHGDQVYLVADQAVLALPSQNSGAAS